MLLIIQGPLGSGKTTIANRIAHSTGCRHYDPMPEQRPDDFPAEGLVIITTNSTTFPEWVHQMPVNVLHTDPLPALFESLPLPGSNGEQFALYQNRRYPADSPDRFVMRVCGKNFTGNTISTIIRSALAYFHKKNPSYGSKP